MPDSQNKQESVTSTSNNSRILSSAVIVQNLSIPSIASQVSPALVNSGALPNTSINDYNSANATQKAAYDKQISDKIEGGDQKLTQVASNAINSLGGT